MKRSVMLSAVAAVLLSVGVGAQGRNFSGAWVIDSEKTAAAGGGAMSGGGGAMVARSASGGSATGAVAVGAGAGGGGGAVVSASGGRARGGGAGGGVSSGLSLTMDANSFTMVNGATTTTYKLDGSVTNIENPMRKVSAKASWQGDKIAIETTAEGPNGPIVTHAFWYLEGDYLVRENKSTGPDGQEVVRKTYYKRS